MVALKDLVVELSPILFKPLVSFFTECVAYMTVVYPDSVPVVFAVTFHGIVGEVALGHFKIGINDNLKNVVPWLHISYIDPLAVNVMTIQIPTSYGDALLSEVGTFIPLTDQLLAFRVLQAEACFVALSHFSSIGCQQVVVSEDVHAVVVPMALMPHPGVSASFGPKVSTPVIVYLGGEAEEPPVSVRPVGMAGSAGQTVLFGCTV